MRVKRYRKAEGRNAVRLFLGTLLVAGRVAAVPAESVEKDVVYKTTNEGTLCLDLYYPASGEGPFPLVVYTHGGGWAAGSKEKASAGPMRRVVEGLNAKGFCVASVQYRLWKKDGNTAMRDCVVDAKDAVRFLAKNRVQYDLDTQRVFTFGDSAGGQIAQMLLLAKPAELPGDPALAESTYQMIAGVSWYGPCDFEKTDLFNHDDRENFRDRFGARILYSDSKPEDKRRLYREMSPVNYLKKESPPLLMIQGDGDTTIPVKHAWYMQENAKAIGAPVEIMIVRHAGHNWRKADGVTPVEPDVTAVVKRTVDFIATSDSTMKR